VDTHDANVHAAVGLALLARDAGTTVEVRLDLQITTSKLSKKVIHTSNYPHWRIAGALGSIKRRKACLYIMCSYRANIARLDVLRVQRALWHLVQDGNNERDERNNERTVREMRGKCGTSRTVTQSSWPITRGYSKKAWRDARALVRKRERVRELQRVSGTCGERASSWGVGWRG